MIREYLERVAGTLAGKLFGALELHAHSFQDLPLMEPVQSAVVDDDTIEFWSWEIDAHNLRQAIYDDIAALPREERAGVAAAALLELDYYLNDIGEAA